jgi:outer membrane translocation and assembly module TamA
MTFLLDSLRTNALNRGQLLWSVDSIRHSDNEHHAWIYEGQTYRWAEISLANSEIGPSERRVKKLERQFIESKKINSTLASIIKPLEDNGYPFASVRFEELSSVDSSLSARLFVVKGPLVLIDSLVVKSEEEISPYYLINYLDLHKGELYSEEEIQAISGRIGEIPFLSETRNPEVQFTDEGAWIFVYPKKRKANTFNGIIGLQQDETDGSLELTGDLQLGLQNVLNRGESFSFEWRRLQSETQELNISAQYPYLWNTGIGLDGGLSIYRRDTSFTSAKIKGGIIYQLKTNNQVEAFVKRENSSGLSTSTGFNLSNSTTVVYGLAARLEKLDYRLNPRKGISFDVEIGAGNKKYTPHSAEGDVPALRKKQYSLETEFSAFIHVVGPLVIQFKSVQGSIFAPEVFENEMYLIGGLNSLRGMNERSIFASSFAIGTVELRFLYDENSNAYLFFDQAWYENSNPSQFVTDTPFGAGIGTRFSTKAGLFSLSYGIGKQFDNEILIRNAKVHFGFVSFF